MKKCFIFLIFLSSSFVYSQQVNTKAQVDSNDVFKTLITDEVVVKAIKANDNTPVTQETILTEDLESKNLGQDLPVLLGNQQSIISYSDAGNGVGYTGLRIRGYDMSRINFTINGIPYNDPESQAVYLVDVPDIVSSTKNLQIQRGVGTSTNGAAAFGGSINLNTNEIHKNPYAEYAGSVGSFSTFKNTISIGTGLLKDRFSIDARASYLKSDGYIDRASAKLWSYFVGASYFYDKTSIRFNHFSGKEITYQAWNGIDKSTLETDRRYNSSGTDWGAKNPPYNNEIDNYKQDHYQLFFSRQIHNNILLNAALFYTRGKGYYEQYKVAANLEDYNLPNVMVGNDTISETDLIRRRWLDNHFYGSNLSMNYNKKKVEWIVGGGWNQYQGKHYGNIIWAQYASTSTPEVTYYNNKAKKTDFNIFSKLQYNITTKLIAFIDLQYRNVNYQIHGIDNDLKTLDYNKSYHFFNPKFGVTYRLKENQKLYASFAVANKEPNRTDFIDHETLPTHETLFDVEAGYEIKKEKWHIGANYYYMYYKNQLVLNGTLNDVGSALRVNVPVSYRTGIELQADYKWNKYFALNGNITWSVNEIKSFIDENNVEHTHSKIAYSPQWLGSVSGVVTPVKNLNITLQNKVVGQQFLDNTSNVALSLKRYAQSDLIVQYILNPRVLKEVQLNLMINNLFNRDIVSNGYVYYGEAYYFPQANINFMLGMRLKF